MLATLLCSSLALAPLPDDPDAYSLGRARGYLDTVGRDVVGTVAQVVATLRTRTRRTAHEASLIDLIERDDRAGITNFASQTVLASDLVDVVAVFNAEGELLALNDVDWRGQKFPVETTQELLDLSFDEREIITGCVRNTADHEVLEFQTTCDFTPRLFGSSGLSIALTTPINDAAGERIGAISTRLRFERLLERLHLDGFEEDGNKIWLVSDHGAYFNEDINRGTLAKPIASLELGEMIQAFDHSGRAALGFEKEGRVMSLYAVPGLETLEGGGVRVLLDASGEWVAAMLSAEIAHRRLTRNGLFVFGGLSVILALALIGLVRSRSAVGRARRDAERASHSKSSFLASTSHEIRTPMAAILGYAELLSDESRAVDSAVRKEALAAIRANGTHLMTLIGDILDLSKIESGSVTLDPHDFNPEDLVRQTFELLGSKADEQSTKLALHVAGGVPSRVHADGLRVRQVLINLVGNAIKFTADGRIDVHLSFAEGQLSVAVKDTGIGMSPEALKNIFRAYGQAERSTTRTHGGTGLGLTISKQLCRLMGGNLTVTSEAGAGSCFTATMEVGPAEPHVEEASAALESDSDDAAAILAGSRILVVDDTPTNLRLLSIMLSRDGADVTTARDGRESIDACTEAEAPFDLIVMDAQMPVMDGTEAFHELRRLGVTSPIVVLTADALSEARRSYLDVGFDDFATKPISKAELRELAAKWVERSRYARGDLERPPQALPSAPEERTRASG